jgi:hypothetical protein
MPFGMSFLARVIHLYKKLDLFEKVPSTFEGRSLALFFGNWPL